ncbi:Peptide chain release factor eRF1/aRF1 [Corchorus olitorius]|uniref:Peptide chain release factor eRF1/aRF1 n=1 Tax=Corchorus olitorius TaxID=93759 RepID=A0A1R3K905_9ROSI|nr:Peptide chain release factor eRF1/aRF1 [Corchorus olitorius]
MISLIIPLGDQISTVTRRLAEEYATCSNIKSRVNRQSVQAAITSALQRLKLYKNVPPNGLVIYAGIVMTEEAGKGKKKFVYDLVPPLKPFGFIIVDGHGTLFGTLSRNRREIVHKFYVQLPNKHGRGGQSQNRLSGIGAEKRQNYLRKAAELATKFFIDPRTNQSNVVGLILAGSTDLKTDLSQSHMFDYRLKAKILKLLDISYGGETGFNQAIEQSLDILADLKFVQQKRLIDKLFEEINQDTKKYVFGVEDTMKVLEMGAIQTLIVWENLEINGYVLKNSATDEILIIKHLSKEQEGDERNFFQDPQLEVEEKMVLLERLAENYENYKRFGCSLEIVTDGSQEGSQFCKGFGGIGGILQYKLLMKMTNKFMRILTQKRLKGGMQVQLLCKQCQQLSIEVVE